MRRIIVTGSYGFIGGAVTKILGNRGDVVLPFDKASGQSIESAYIPKADAIIHLAGVLGTSELFDDPYHAVRVNVEGTLRVLDACKAHDMAYVGITMPVAFPSIYTATKVCATRMASAYHHAYGIPVTHVRAFNAFGPGQKHGPGHPRKIIPAFATQAWAGEPITIWGDGQQTVDLIHVDHIARLLVDALDMGSDDTLDGGSGVPFTVNEVAEMVLDATGSKAGVEHLPMRRGEQATFLVAKGEGWDHLDWEPSFDLAELEATVQSYK